MLLLGLGLWGQKTFYFLNLKSLACREFFEALRSLSVCKEQLTAHIVAPFFFNVSCSAGCCWTTSNKMCVDDI
jgi:hypothetical protein